MASFRASRSRDAPQRVRHEAGTDASVRYVDQVAREHCSRRYRSLGRRDERSMYAPQKGTAAPRSDGEDSESNSPYP